MSEDGQPDEAKEWEDYEGDEISKNRASGGASQCCSIATLLPTKQTTKHAKFIQFGNVTKIMTKKVMKPKNKLTEENIDTVIDGLFASILGDNWQVGSRKKRASN